MLACAADITHVEQLLTSFFFFGTGGVRAFEAAQPTAPPLPQESGRGTRGDEDVGVVHYPKLYGAVIADKCIMLAAGMIGKFGCIETCTCKVPNCVIVRSKALLKRITCIAGEDEEEEQLPSPPRTFVGQEAAALTGAAYPAS